MNLSLSTSVFFFIPASNHVTARETANVAYLSDILIGRALAASMKPRIVSAGTLNGAAPTGVIGLLSPR